MQKLCFFLILLLFPVILLAQQRTKIYVDRFDRSRIDVKNNVSYLRNPVFRQDNAILTCDSAVFYEKKNVFEAYQNVHINQADTVNIYSDRLTYDGNTKMAHLSSNVRLLDQESVLTTNVLDYDMAAKIGTYINGGKIVNKDVTLTSKNGYYFSNSRDAYFRYNVVAVTPQSVIKSDTLRYNTLTNWTYFYGPTNITGKDDNLYTENGAYNTKSQYAYFGKKNLYTQGSRSLKGDSLYYDGQAGYGKAVRNIVFIDTADKTLMRGQLGYYYKKDERTLVTRNAYFGLGTSDSIKVKDVMQPDSLWLGADTLETQMVLRKTLTLIPGPVILKDNEVGSENPADTPAIVKSKTATPPIENKAPLPKITDTLKKESEKDSIGKSNLAGKETTDSILIKKDSIPVQKEIVKSDTIKSKNEKATDSLLVKKSTVPKQKDSTGLKNKIAADRILTQKKTPSKDTVKKQLPLHLNKDSIPSDPLDTVRARIIKAYHTVNVYKSNMQAKADSLFYTSADSTLRWYYNPIMWSEGSQQTGDTIYLQMKNKKLNTVQVLQKAFTVNVYKDSTKFNQIKGKKITAFFKDGKMNSMYVDGNAESIYFTKDDDGKAYKEMNQTVSSRIKITFKDSEIRDVVPIKDVDGAITPVDQVKEDVLLTGFIWKPELRPTSKLQVTNPKPKSNPKKIANTKKTDSATAEPSRQVQAKNNKTTTDHLSGQRNKVPDSLTTPKKVPSKSIDNAIKIKDSVAIPKKVPSKLTDSATKVIPDLIKDTDSLIKQSAPLKKR